MYFAASTTTPQNTTKHCLGIATASSITSPYTPTSTTPFVYPFSQDGAIDPAGFLDTEGNRYLVYKIESRALGGGGLCGNGDETHATPIMLQKMLPDGITVDGSTPVQILDRDAADGPLIEAPSLIRSSGDGGPRVLFFSSTCFNRSSYDTNYATASQVVGLYTKATMPPLAGPGCQGNSDDGRLFIPGGATVGADGEALGFSC